MGSKQNNFYNEVYQRAGYADLAIKVQDLWAQPSKEAIAGEDACSSHLIHAAMLRNYRRSRDIRSMSAIPARWRSCACR